MEIGDETAVQASNVDKEGPRMKKLSTTRRKYSRELEVAFLKEVVFAEAHFCPWRKQSEAYATVAKALNDNNSLSWTVDSKHCVDKFRALLKSFKSNDVACRASTGGPKRLENESNYCTT